MYFSLFYCRMGLCSNSNGLGTGFCLIHLYFICRTIPVYFMVSLLHDTDLDAFAGDFMC